MMIVHHEGAVDMPYTELAQGSSPAVRQLAQQIINTQQVEITEMQTLLHQSDVRLWIDGSGTKGAIPRWM